MKQDLIELSVTQLLTLFAEVLDELKTREVVRTRNNPVADYAEWLTARALHLQLQSNSNEGFDAIDSGGIRYQIKGRRLQTPKSSRQLSIIRRLKDNTFDFLIGILFDNNFSIVEAYKIPHHLIANNSRYSDHVNGHIMSLKGDIVAADEVERIDNLLRTYAH